MKRIGLWFGTLALIVAFAAASSAYAGKGRAYTLRVSYFMPDYADSWFTFGGSVGTMIDESIEIAIGTDIYYKYYTKQTEVATDKAGTNIVTMEVENNTVIVPLMAELMVKFPALWKGSIFGHGGIGYEVMWNKEQNYAQNVTDKRWYGGFAWQLGAGVSLRLGRSSALFAEGYYHHAKVRRKKGVVEYLPVYEQVNLSGVGARVGLSIGPL
jgi:hypothetical protein